MLCLAADCLDLKLVNALSHISNLAAQNKIGSNFDVSSALFGSHIYVNRFPKAAQRYLESSDKAIFDMKIDQLRRIKVGSSVKVYMLDQKKGADTRVMVGSFLK
jgi:phosphomevalonate kinase